MKNMKTATTKENSKKVDEIQAAKLQQEEPTTEEIIHRDSTHGYYYETKIDEDCGDNELLASAFKQLYSLKFETIAVMVSIVKTLYEKNIISANEMAELTNEGNITRCANDVKMMFDKLVMEWDDKMAETLKQETNEPSSDKSDS